MENENNPFEEGKDNCQSPKCKESKLKHCFFYINQFIIGLFQDPNKIAKPKPTPVDTNGILTNALDSLWKESDIPIINNAVRVHRIIENTKARRRLENWSTKVIAFYLLAVLALIITSYCKRFQLLEIPSKIMIVILSTTTINIIGLGLIVLKGHFTERCGEEPEDTTKQKK